MQLDLRRKTVPEWSVSPDGYLLLFNVNIVDVNTGEFMEEHGILVKGKKIFKLVKESEFKEISSIFF